MAIPQLAMLSPRTCFARMSPYRLCMDEIAKLEPFLLSKVERLLITRAKGQHLAGPDDCKGITVPRSKRSGNGQWLKQRQRAIDALAERVSTKRDDSSANLDKVHLILGEVDDNLARMEEKDKDLGVR